MADARTWRTYAGRVPNPVNGRDFMDFGDPRTVRLHAREPVKVELTEDPDGTYWGWIDAGAWAKNAARPGEPAMIQPHEGMFTMQFPYGPKAEVERGHGEIVRMSCRAVDEELNRG